MGDLLSDFAVTKVRFSETPNIRSHFGTCRLDGYQVDVIGEIEKRNQDDEWVGLPDLSEILRQIALDGHLVPVLDLAYEREAYCILGRKATVSRIDELLTGVGSPRYSG